VKKIIRYLLIITCFFVTKNIFAFEYIKFPGNPLPITYDFGYQSLLQAHIYKDGNIYRGILTAKKAPTDRYSLVLIESIDGFSFKLIKEIIASDKDISNPRLFIDGAETKILYAQRESVDFYKIYSINCNDEFICDPPQLLLDPNINNLNENHGHFAPFIRRINGHYFLFYGSWGNNGFSTYLAHSDHFGDWQKCPNFVLTGLDGAFIDIDATNINIYAHQSNSTGIQKLAATLPLTCDSIFNNLGYIVTKSTTYDQRHIIFPSIINNGDQQLLYYTGLGSDNIWHLNLAFNSEISPTSAPSPTYTPTPTIIPTLPIIITPTITLFPTATPSPVDRIPIVLLPGFLASWNKEALLHNQIVPRSAWKIATFVKEYEGLIKTYENLGYQINKDLFIFAYDWRKPLSQLINDLNNYIQQLSINNQQFNIVGHSLGGLIARIYDQEFNPNNIEKIITVGSPHKGVAAMYKLVEAGELEKSDNSLWLSAKLLLNLNRKNLESDKQLLYRLFPILIDLFPTYDFLKSQGELINVNDMNIKNLTLLKYANSNSSNIQSIVGERGNTLKGFTVMPQNMLDKVLGNYPDGRPISEYHDIGDYTVLSESASLQNVRKLNLSHGELIYKTFGIKEILNGLGIVFHDDQIVEGSGTVITPSIIFLIKSPGKIEVEYDNRVFKESDGIIYIPNAGSGEYKLKVIGIYNGYYEVVIGQVGQNNDSWNTIYGEINSLIPSLQTDSYKIYFDSINPFKYFVDKSDPGKLINELVLYLKSYNYKKNTQIIKNIGKIHKTNVKDHKHLFYAINKELVKIGDFTGLEKLENIYSKMIVFENNAKNLEKDINRIKSEFLKEQSKFLKLKDKNTNFDEKLIYFEIIDEKIKIYETLDNNQNSYKEILIGSLKNLLNRI